MSLNSILKKDALAVNRRVAWLFLCGSIFYFLVLSLSVGYPRIAGFSLLLIILIQATQVINYWNKRFSLSATVVSLLLANLALAIISYTSGRKLQFYQFYLAIIVAPLFLLEWKQRKLRLFFVSLSFFGYAFFSSGFPFLMRPNFLSEASSSTLYWILFPLRLVFLASVLKVVGELMHKSKAADARINLMMSQLREGARTHAALLSALPDVIFQVSWDGRVLDYIASSGKGLFSAMDPLVGKMFVDMLPLECRSEATETLRKVIFDGKTRVYTFSVSHETSGQPARFFDLRMVGRDQVEILAIFQDVTIRKQAELIVLERQSQSVSESKMAALGEMAAGIAHEINNPLAIIQGKAQQLREMAEASELSLENTLEMAERIESTTQRISRIIRALRFFSRDGTNDPFEHFSLHEGVTDILELCRERFLSHRIVLKVAQIPEHIYIECRPVQIGQVLLNLLNNAHDAVVKTKDPWIELGFFELDGAVELTITDSGHGIIEPLRSKIFEPFFTTKGIGKGTGLGLSISKGIIESHHGSITLDAASEYTCFRVRLPRTQIR
jgi:signal transduction histidine kinase